MSLSNRQNARFCHTTGLILRLAFGLCLAFVLVTCGKHLPNPVQSHDGVSYIPLDDTAFLIPEKTWLKGYSRRSTDGTVHSITLHATIAAMGTFTQNGEDKTAGSVNLSSNPFYREFTDKIELSDEAKALPGMQGSGMARDLQEAATVSSSLAKVLTEFSAATTREEQRGRVAANDEFQWLLAA